jgi:hypothetical protein
MNLKERLFWIAGIILVILFAQQKSHKVDNLQTLITTYQLESNIQDAQITDIAQQFAHAQRLEYDRGFEAGRTQAAIVLMNKGSLYNYTDGYHAATSQFGIANPDGENKAYLNITTDVISNKKENDHGSPR